MKKKVRWFLIDTDAGIMDEAEKKGIIMWRWGFTTSKKVGKIYMVLQGNDGIGCNYYIMKEENIEEEGFGWALEEWDKELKNE